MSHLSVSEQRSVKAGLLDQGAKVTDTTGRGTRVSFGTKTAFINLNGDSGIVKKARGHILRLGLVWPPEAGRPPLEQPNEEETILAAAAAAKERALIAEANIASLNVELQAPALRPRNTNQKLLPWTRLEEITPAKAREFLDTWLPMPGELGNRIKTSSKIDTFVRLYDTGAFRPYNGDTVKIDINGQMRDGQHRMEAVIQYGKPVTFLIAYDVDPDAFDTYDQGNRTAADAVRISGQPQAGLLAALAKTRMAKDAGYTLEDLYRKQHANRGSTVWSVTEINAYVNDNAEHLLAMVRRGATIYKLVSYPNTVLNQLHVEELDEFFGPEVVDNFFAAVRPMMVLPTNVRNQYKSKPEMAFANVLTERLVGRRTAALLQKCLEKFVTNQTVGVLKWADEIEQWPLARMRAEKKIRRAS
jgi:hypothetical protein